MPVPEDMRRTVRHQFRLTPEAHEALQVKPVGKRSEWVSKLILDAARKLGWRREKKG